MTNSLVLTICAHDRPGVMKLISQTITDSKGNWLESRMARLGGQFAGIVRVECAEDKLLQLTESLQALSSEGISVQIHDQGDLSDYPYTRCLRLDIYGNDRPGIVSQLTQAVSSAGANIEELNTSIESAAMAGHSIFHASGTVCVPDSTDEQELINAVEALSDDLNIEIGGVV
jgi:glycine cleavage system regulatory protein